MPWARNPVTFSLDANLSKRFLIWSDRVAMVLRADFLNVLNHPNFFFNPNTGHDLYGGDFNRQSLTNPSIAPFSLNSNFGKLDPNNTNNGRTIRLAIRITF